MLSAKEMIEVITMSKVSKHKDDLELQGMRGEKS